mgnify:CR=1 FL=1
MPGLFGWLLIAPMLLWLVAFVVVPTGILAIYSLGERANDSPPVAFAWNWQNYERVFGGTQLGPVARYAGIAAVLAALVGLIRYLRPGSAKSGARPAAVRTAVIVFAAALFAFSWLNFEEVFSGTYVRIFMRSIAYAGFTTIVCAIIGYPVAYYIGRASPDRRNLLLLMVMIPFWTSFLIRTYAWIRILAQEGLLNSLLLYTKVLSEPLEILYTPNAVIIGLVYSYLPFIILPIYGSVEKLDSSLIEAALDLGAGPLRAFGRVIIPLTMPGIIAGALLVFVPSIGMFAITDLMGGRTVPMIGNVIQNQFGQARDWPFGSALGVTLLVMFGLALWISTARQKSDSVLG